MTEDIKLSGGGEWPWVDPEISKPGKTTSIIELNRKLNQPRIAARRDDASDITGMIICPLAQFMVK
jgi:hypothetical protein